MSLFASTAPLGIPQKVVMLLAPPALNVALLLACLLAGHHLLALCRSGLRRDPLWCIAGGYMGLCLLTMAGFHAGLSAASLWWGALALLLASALLPGPRSLLADCWRAGPARLPQMLKNHPVLSGLVLIFLAGCFGKAMLPQNHGDPLYYHLPAPWQWVQAGRAGFLPHMPWLMQDGWSAYFNALLATLSGDRFLMMITAQLLNLSFGLGLTALVLVKLPRTLAGVGVPLMVVLAFVTFPAESAMLQRAKNDGFVLFFLVLHFLHWQREDVSKPGFAGYALLFFSLGLKSTAAFYLVPFLLVRFGEVMRWAPGAGGSRLRTVLTHAGLLLPAVLLFSLPVWWRNMAWSGNPLFPAMNSIFQSPLMTPALEREVARFSFIQGSLPEILMAQASRMLLAKPVYLAGVLLAAWFAGWRRTCLFILGCFALLCLVTGQGMYARFSFFMYALLAWVGVSGLLMVITRLRPGWITRDGPRWPARLLIVLLILPGSGWEVPVASALNRSLPFMASSESYGAWFSRHNPVYDFHRAASAVLGDEARVFSFFENECFFLDAPLSVPENHPGASRILQAKDYVEALRGLREEGFTHLQWPPAKEDYFPVLTADPRFARDFTRVLEVKGYRLYARKEGNGN